MKKTSNRKKTNKGKKSSKQLKIPAIKFKKLNTKRLAVDLIILACIILVGVSGWLWWDKVMLNPDRALQDALANSLKTRSITKTVDQTSPASGFNQVTYLSLFPQSEGSYTRTKLSQGIGSNTTTVTTETIGAPTADYVRYTDISGGANQPGVQRLQSMLGVWAKREQDLSKGQRISFLNEGLFGVIPFGYLGDDQQSQILGIINQKNLYKYTSASRSMENKRPVYVYTMSINPSNLVEVLRDYSQLSGLGDPSQLNPEQYKGAGDIKILLTVDIFSRQIVRIQYSTGRVENYTGHNLYRPLNLPGDTIPVEELQRRLQGGAGANA
ncbi:MAG TPA: hypothetical protein VFK11_00905 [Candidatus Saccharimonadales bacterium]|nr:hypothetical protein [Candidatus Saccharimonadales bacterium]